MSELEAEKEMLMHESQVESACWENRIWQHNPDGRIVPRRWRRAKDEVRKQTRDFSKRKPGNASLQMDKNDRLGTVAQNDNVLQDPRTTPPLHEAPVPRRHRGSSTAAERSATDALGSWRKR